MVNTLNYFCLVPDCVIMLQIFVTMIQPIEKKYSSLQTPRYPSFLQQYQDLFNSPLVKNAFTRHCILVLRQVSVLNNNMVQIPSTLVALQTNFKGKNSFSHIQRLHNMLYAYGATVIEIVRRKEFCESDEWG